MLPVPGREAEWKTDSPRKTLWVTEMLAWARLEGQMLSKLNPPPQDKRCGGVTTRALRCPRRRSAHHGAVQELMGVRLQSRHSWPLQHRADNRTLANQLQCLRVICGFRRGSVPRNAHACRIFCTQSLGTLRHAWEYLGMVHGLVREISRRRCH